jgi:hypothetical protein
MASIKKVNGLFTSGSRALKATCEQWEQRCLKAECLAGLAEFRLFSFGLTLAFPSRLLRRRVETTSALCPSVVSSLPLLPAHRSNRSSVDCSLTADLHLRRLPIPARLRALGTSREAVILSRPCGIWSVGLRRSRRSARPKPSLFRRPENRTARRAFFSGERFSEELHDKPYCALATCVAPALSLLAAM